MCGDGGDGDGCVVVHGGGDDGGDDGGDSDPLPDDPSVDTPDGSPKAGPDQAPQQTDPVAETISIMDRAMAIAICRELPHGPSL